MKNTNFYQRIAATYSDYQKERKTVINAHKPYEFKNLMPFEVIIFYSRPWISSELNLAAKLPPNGYEKDIFNDKNGNTLQGDGSITAYYVDKKTKTLMQLCPAIILTNYLKKILIGAITYDSYADTDYHNSYADIPSLRIKNQFPFPVEIWYNRGISNLSPGNVGYAIPGSDGNVVIARLAANSRKSTQYDIILRNFGNGFNIGDTISVGLCETGKPFLSITLTDPLVRNLYVGVIDVS